MLVRRIVELLLVALVVSGCSLLHPWATDRTLDGSYDQVFQATLETLEARGFPIERVNREKGRIETGKRPVDAMDPYRPVETVRAYVEREEKGKVSVRLFMTFLRPPPTNGSTSPRDGERHSTTGIGEAIDKSTVYDDYLDAIADRVQEFRGRQSIANSGSED